MAIPFYDEITFRLKKENIVNSEDEDLKKLGLEPLIMYLTPLFIDPDGKLYCSSNSNHYETIINNHVKDALSFLNNDYANYVINKKLTYLVYEDNIYFMDINDYKYFVAFPRIKEKIEEMINKKLYVKDVSMDDIFDSYYLNYVDLNSEKCKFVLIEPTISEELKMYYDANNPTKIIKCSSDITGIDVLNMVNYNANIFDVLPFYTKGVYNDNALNLINEYSKIKKDIYDKIFSIGLKSADINEMINNLISKLCAYKNYGFLDEKLKNSKIFKDISNDLLVMMFGYSKIETTISRTITTSVDNIYESYDFNSGKGLDDTSENDRDLTLASDSTAKVQNKALVLSGDKSYVETPIEQLGNGNALSFDITLSSEPESGDILFESDAAYGTHDIRIMSNGKLGFTRELYDYYFDYTLPVGEKVNIKIVTQQQVTKLYVNGQFVSNATGEFNHNGTTKKSGITNATFALPLQRIGSETNAVQATIDNVNVTAADMYNKSKWTGTTNSETTYNNVEGLLRYAFDNDYTSRWHSNWKGATDKLTGSNSFYAEINFGQKYTINQFSFTPRTDTASGYVTKADLYIKANDSDEWTLVAQDQTFAADAAQKTFTFDAQEVQYVKFVAKASSDGWVAVSEFDIANTAQDPDQPEADKTALQELVNQAVTDFTGYTSESVTAYKVALDNAKEVLTNEDATQAEVDEAIAALTNAVLVTDKSKLQEKIDQAVTDFDGYTADSVAAYKAALARLNEVLADTDATPAQVSEAIAAFDLARLVKDTSDDGKKDDDKKDDDKKNDDKKDDNKKDDSKKEDGTNDNSSSTNGKADKKDTASKAAKTGDASTALPYMLLMLASGSAVVILKKKKEQ